MEDIDGVLNEIRRNYAIIYRWHNKNGLRTYKAKHAEDVIQERPWFRKYMHLLEEMPSPQAAGLEAMSAVAAEVLWGCMEWSYWVEIEPGLPLNKVAQRIKELVRGMEEGHVQDTGKVEEEDTREVLKQLHNIGPGARSKAMAVEIKVPARQLTPDAYAHFASLAYADVARHTQTDNVGGAVALADTNLELERKHGRVGPSASLLKFRNAKAMHFTESKRNDNIAAFARDRTVSILSIKIGV